MPISNFFVKLLLRQAREANEYDEETIDMFRYGLETVFWELEKLVYFFLIFWLLSYELHFLMATLVILTTRPFAGGVHVESIWKCFALTGLSYASTFFILPNLIPLNHLSLLLVAAFSIIMTFVATPVRSAKREKIEKKEYDKPRKWLATMLTMVWLGFAFYNQGHFFATVVVWTLFLQNIQMLIGYWRKRVGNV